MVNFGKVSELNSKSYLLEGGTLIPEGSNLDDYKTPGNYYCNSSLIVPTIQNIPPASNFAGIAFTLKVEMGAGTINPIQTYREYRNRNIATRVWISGSWTEWSYQSNDATVLGQTITYSTHTIPTNGTMTIEEKTNGSFYQLAVFRGSIGNGYNAVLLTGYGIGTDSRYHYKLLDDGNAVDISISNTSFIIINKSSNNSLIAKIFRLYGSAPTVSVS